MRGFFFISRQIFDSPIWRDNPHHLKLFLYLVGTARHRTKPKKFNNFSVERGELVTSLADISEDNEYLERGRVKKWSRAKVSRMLNHLEKSEYISLLADTYGTHIKIVNYNTYQSQDTYKADRSETEVKRVCNGSETQVRIYNNGNKDNNGNKELPKNGNQNTLKLLESFRPGFIPVNLWTEVIKTRKFKKLQNTELGLKTFTNSLKRGIDAGYSIERCIGEYSASSWKRFNHEWIEDGQIDEQKTCGMCRSFCSADSPDKCNLKGGNNACSEFR